MRLKPSLVKRFLWMSAGPLSVAAVLVAGSPSMAAEDARYVPAKRPAKKAAASVAAPPPLPPRGRIVRVISMPLQEECPADDNESMNAVRAFIDPATGELRAPTAGRGGGPGPRDRAKGCAPRSGGEGGHGQRQRQPVLRARRGSNAGRRRAHRRRRKAGFPLHAPIRDAEGAHASAGSEKERSGERGEVGHEELEDWSLPRPSRNGVPRSRSRADRLRQRDDHDRQRRTRPAWGSTIQRRRLPSEAIPARPSARSVSRPSSSRRVSGARRSTAPFQSSSRRASSRWPAPQPRPCSVRRERSRLIWSPAAAEVSRRSRASRRTPCTDSPSPTSASASTTPRGPMVRTPTTSGPGSTARSARRGV